MYGGKERDEICLESTMACGFGICFACVPPIKKELGGPYYKPPHLLEARSSMPAHQGERRKSIDKEAWKPGKE